MGSRALTVASSDKRSRELAEIVARAGATVDTTTTARPPRDGSPYRLMVWEGSPRDRKPNPFLERLPDKCHIILLLPELDIRWVSYYLADPRINHFLGSPFVANDLRHVVEKLASGDIFGLGRYLRDGVKPKHRRITSYEERCRLLDEIDEYTSAKPVRGKIRRAAGSVAEELLMNAMYNAPIDANGKLLFDDVDPSSRIHRPTPRPVSVRFAHDKGTFYLSVRDRFGSFQRDHLARYLLRCVADDSPIEGKKRGAGLGLYQITMSVTRMAINVIPGRVTEFVCVIDPPVENASPLRLLTITTGRSGSALVG